MCVGDRHQNSRWCSYGNCEQGVGLSVASVCPSRLKISEVASPVWSIWHYFFTQLSTLLNQELILFITSRLRFQRDRRSKIAQAAQLGSGEAKLLLSILNKVIDGLQITKYSNIFSAFFDNRRIWIIENVLIKVFFLSMLSDVFFSCVLSHSWVVPPCLL